MKKVTSIEVHCVSSNIEWWKAEHEEEGEAMKLTVKFVSGGLYVYSHVPGAMIMKMVEAESIGSLFSREIRNAFVYKKLE